MPEHKNSDRPLSQRSLDAHSWIGLFAATFLYLLCFSGVLTVIGQEMERWEQPGIDEFNDYSPTFIDQAYRRFVETHTEDTEHIHIVFPRDAIPRIVVENDHQAFFVNHDGSLGAKEHAPWIKMVIDLHKHLHLPSTIGTLLTGLIAALLLALIVSGVLAHKTMVKEAFRLRLGRSKLTQSIDLHNRLSVWGLPFHIMIALTSCYFGLVGLLLTLAAGFFHGGDQRHMIEQVFGSEPELFKQAPLVDVKASIENLRSLKPDAKPIFMTIHEAGSENQFVEFYLMKDQRLIYSENFRFDAAGNFIGQTDPDQLPIGSQVLLSTYRLHFGDFAGFTLKLLYVLLGSALTYIAISGVNIWLNKRRKEDLINILWGGFVWALPAAFALSFLLSQILNVNPYWSFWSALLTASLAGVAWKTHNSPYEFSTVLKIMTTMFCFAAALSYAIKYSEHSIRGDFWSMITVLMIGALISFIAYTKHVPRQQSSTEVSAEP
ncbi:PepSY-associated TM helix domain-containing protein [Pseudoteredinibacter isoporae]|uniref:PepSY-associated TM helix domain-containing protein n=1 Tax=Pseudoteredinibacter isoporae TaxID=570281 RepID=UPI003107552B